MLVIRNVCNQFTHLCPWPFYLLNSFYLLAVTETWLQECESASPAALSHCCLHWIHAPRPSGQKGCRAGFLLRDWVILKSFLHLLLYYSPLWRLSVFFCISENCGDLSLSWNGVMLPCWLLCLATVLSPLKHPVILGDVDIPANANSMDTSQSNLFFLPNTINTCFYKLWW